MDRQLNATPAARPDGALARRMRWGLLLAAVLLAHLMGVAWLEDTLVDWAGAQAPMPPRMEVAFVRALAPAVPAAAAPTPPRAAARRAPRQQAVVPAVAASATAPATPASAAADTAAAVEPAAVPEAVRAAVPTEPATSALVADSPPPAAPAASSASAPAFEWPPSTRLTYALSGNYRGEVQGSARVQWVREGSRYQVHLDVEIGPSFAPLLWRRMTSDGELGETGLVPRRYDEATRLPFRAPRRLTVQFMEGQVVLANGSLHAAPPAVQDTASQFVQLTWMFTLRPQLLQVGNTIELPLALPRRLDRWRYEVVAQERLATPVGEVEAFHLKPRRAASRPRGELSAEVWFAPSLQYLPVRIRIEQDAETFVDLVLDAAPMQAAAQAPR